MMEVGIVKQLTKVGDEARYQGVGVIIQALIRQ
jgi:hypothetical protein